MKPKRSLASVALEMLAVLLVTALAFSCGLRTAQAERGYTAMISRLYAVELVRFALEGPQLYPTYSP